jgi:plasmid stabilization system protein ParE
VSFGASRAAASDLAQILEQGLRQFGAAQAAQYLDGIETVFLELAVFPRSSPQKVDLYRNQRGRSYGSSPFSMRSKKAQMS